jgi:hypothetical protein
MAGNRVGEILALRSPEQDGRYLHWDELRRRTPPNGLSSEQWWFAVLLAREASAKHFGLKTRQDHGFWFATTETIQSLSHEIDRDASGALQVPDAITNKATQSRYLISSLIQSCELSMATF